MTREQLRRGTLEAIERILNRGGEPDEVRRSVAAALSVLYPSVHFDLHGTAGSTSARPLEGVHRVAIVLGDARLGELVVATPDPSDEAFLERVATLVSPYC